MDNNEAFEKWFEQWRASTWKPLPSDERKNLPEHWAMSAKHHMEIAWQAAQQQNAGEIAELKADNERLRDLLERSQNGLRWYQDAHPEDASNADDELHDEIDEALSATPQQSLQNLITETIQRCQDRLANGEYQYIQDAIQDLEKLKP